MTTVNARVLRRTVTNKIDLYTGALQLANYQWGLATAEDVLVCRDGAGAFHEFSSDASLPALIESLSYVKDPVATYGALPTGANGDLAMALDTGAYYRYNSGTWGHIGDGASHNSLSNLQLASADVTWGHIDDQAQTIVGLKKFSSGLVDTKLTYTTPGQIGDSVASNRVGNIYAWNVETYNAIVDTLEVNIDLFAYGNSTLGNSVTDVTTIRGSAVFTDQNASTLAVFNASKQLVSSTVTTSNLTDLTDGGDSALHYHSADRARAVHTGTQLASTISDFSSAVTAVFGEAHVGTWSITTFGLAGRFGHKDFNAASNSGFLQFATTGNVSIAGPTVSIYGTITLFDSVTFGDSTSDTVTFTGRLASDFVPSTNNTRTIGSSSLRLANLYSTLLNVSGTATMAGINASGDCTLGGAGTNAHTLYGSMAYAAGSTNYLANEGTPRIYSTSAGGDFAVNGDLVIQPRTSTAARSIRFAGALTNGGAVSDFMTILGGASAGISMMLPLTGTSATLAGNCTFGDSGTDSHIINGDLSTNVGTQWEHNGNLRLKRATTGEGSFLLFGDATYSAFIRARTGDNTTLLMSGIETPILELRGTTHIANRPLALDGNYLVVARDNVCENYFSGYIASQAFASSFTQVNPTSLRGTRTIPSDVWVTGKTIRIILIGQFSVPGSVRVKLGSTTLASVSTTGSNSKVHLEVIGTVRSVGASVTISYSSKLLFGSSGGAATPQLVSATTSLNTTISNDVIYEFKYDSVAGNFEVYNTLVTIE